MNYCNPVCTSTEYGLKLIGDDQEKVINATLYNKIVRSLMYLTSIRVDIMHGVSLISRYINNLTKNHLLAVKRIFHYLKGMSNFEILYKARAKENLFGFSDSGYVGDLEDRKITSGFYFIFFIFLMISCFDIKEATNCDFFIYRS